MQSLKQGQHCPICATSQTPTGGNVLCALELCRSVMLTLCPQESGCSRFMINSAHINFFKILLTLRPLISYGIFSKLFFRIGTKGLHVFHGRCMYEFGRPGTS